MQETDLEPANLGRIAAFYYLKYQMLDAFSSSLQSVGDKQLKMKQLFEILTQSYEFRSSLTSLEIDTALMR